MEKTTIKLPGKNNFFIQEAYKVLRTNLQKLGRAGQKGFSCGCRHEKVGDSGQKYYR